MKQFERKINSLSKTSFNEEHDSCIIVIYVHITFHTYNTNCCLAMVSLLTVQSDAMEFLVSQDLPSRQVRKLKCKDISFQLEIKKQIKLGVKIRFRYKT